MKKVKDVDIIYGDRGKIEAILSEIYAESANPAETGRKAIGTYMEKTLHKVIKRYYEPDTRYHEIEVGGYIADISRDNNITEIQTGNLSAMRVKLADYLSDGSIGQVKVVYPLKAVKHLCWIDKKTGEMTTSTRSAKYYEIYSFYDEIYFIKNFIPDDRFILEIIMLEASELKYLDGWGKYKKNNATKIDVIPKSVINVRRFSGAGDYLELFPPEIRACERFTVKQLSKHSGVKGKPVYSFLNVMLELKLIERTGKKGNAVIYGFI
jgi:hypothetical protein